MARFTAAVKMFMQLGRDREPESEEESRNQAMRHEEAEALAMIHAGAENGIAPLSWQEISFFRANLANRAVIDLA